MADTLIYDPATEFEVLEEFEYSEEIQRPEALRFYTLDEQLEDYFDKVLPKTRKITKFERIQIKNEISRLRELYSEIVTVTDSDYTVDQARKKVNVPWVTPIYSAYNYTPFSFAESWTVFYDKANRGRPNFYTQMLTALPKPYKSAEDIGVPLTETSMLVNEDGMNPIHGLGLYNRTKGVIHDDGHLEVIQVPIANTADDLRVKGYYIQNRSFEIPNPQEGHPFFASNRENKVITNESLNTIFPTIEAILTHGVPKTSDVYGEGKRFLKLYDVKLSQVPWASWRENFPPVDTIISSPNVVSVKFPDSDDRTAPSKSLQDLYVNAWYDAIEPRLWLMQQEDGGSMVAKMLLSKASKSGLLPPDVAEKPSEAPTQSSIEECFNFETFQSMLESGVYRPPNWEAIAKAIKDDKKIPTGVCASAAFVIKERQESLTKGKQAWLETTEADIIANHRDLLLALQYREPDFVSEKYQKALSKPVSELEKNVQAILKDQERTEIDKAMAIELIVRSAVQKNKVYYDAEDSFVVCSHTIAILKGELESDPKAFFNEWTAVDEGFNVCRYCSEQIGGEVLVAQDEFDEQGNAIVSYDAITKTVFEGEHHIDSFANSLNELKTTVFELTNPGESMMFFLLIILQVLPEPPQLVPILGFIRQLSLAIKAQKFDKERKDRLQSFAGIAGMVILLQTHNPFLTPRRSFGAKTLKMSGFPRDTDDSDDSPILDMILRIIKTTFDESSLVLNDPAIRAAASKPKEARKEAVAILKQASARFRTQLESAKERYVASPVVETVPLISLPVLQYEKSKYKPGERLGEEEKTGLCDIFSTRSMVTGKYPPSVRQKQDEFYPSRPSAFAVGITAEPPRFPVVRLSEADIRKRAKLGFPKGIKLDKIESFLRSDTDGQAILSLMNRIMDIVSRNGFDLRKLAQLRQIVSYLDSKMNPSLLRDIAKGLAYELLHDIASAPNKVSLIQALNYATQRDLVIKMILLTREAAEEQEGELRKLEREEFKRRLRDMDDTQRELARQLMDFGLGSYLFTNEDREMLVEGLRLKDPDQEYDEIMRQADEDMPEEGYNAQRDDDDDAVPQVDGRELDVDHGGYGDRRERPADSDYERAFRGFDEDEGFGI
jgi:hypothetical protein